MDQFTKWLKDVDRVCIQTYGVPWNAVCVSAVLSKEAYAAGKLPVEFL